MPYTGDTHNVIENADNGAGTDRNLPSFFQKYPSLLWYPNGKPNNDNNDPNNKPPPKFPYEYQWGTYAPVNNDHATDGCVGNAYPYTTPLVFSVHLTLVTQRLSAPIHSGSTHA